MVHDCAMKENGSEEKGRVLLPLPLGEVAERSEDGEGPLSQPVADSLSFREEPAFSYNM